MSEPLLKADGIGTGYGQIQVLSKVSLHAYQGEAVCVLGRNGAGKSTLLRTLMGLHPLWGGSISVAGRPMNKLEDRLRAGVRLVMEGRRIFREQTVDDNLMVATYGIRHLSRRERTQRIANVLERFPHLARRRDQEAGVLSGGEAQMLVIAQALVGEPTLVLLDEPSQGLAPIVLDDLEALIIELKEAGCTVVLVEQEVPRALRVCDRAYFLQLGTIIDSGDTATYRNRPELVREHMGFAPAHED